MVYLPNPRRPPFVAAGGEGLGVHLAIGPIEATTTLTYWGNWVRRRPRGGPK
jgi:hypothetical protein